MEKQNNELYKALNSAIADLDVVVKDASGYKYKYASMHSVLKVVNPVLQKHGLSVFHVMQQDDFGVFLKSTLAHISGDVLESRMPLFFRQGDMKELGAALTYARRYAVQAFLNLAIADGDLDEDQGKPREVKVSIKKESTVGPTQMKILSEKLSDEEALQQVLDEFKVPRIADLPVRMYKLALNRADEIMEEMHA